MTLQSEILNDKNYVPMLDHGFVGLTEVMGSDATIVQSARVSYGKGTRKVNEDRGLIRYLLKNKHNTPVEMMELRFHCKMPIFVARQWIRHRTANVNEMSARYSVLPEEFYIPDIENIQPQSTNNKQGRAGGLDPADAAIVKQKIEASSKQAYQDYQVLLGEVKSDEFTEEFSGIARELARMVLPVNFYTELFWKIDAHNLFHFLKLRCDPHAQYEIRVYANAICDLVKVHAPLVFEAFEDFIRDATNVSRMETNLIKDLISGITYKDLLVIHIDDKTIAEAYGMSARDLTEFKQKWNI